MMHSPAAERVLAAVAQAIERRYGLAGTGVFQLGPDGPCLSFASGALAEPARRERAEAGVAAVLAAPLEPRETRQVEPAIFGLDFRFGAIHPIDVGGPEAIGMLLVTAGNARRLGSGLSEALDDAARIAAALLEVGSRPTQPNQPGQDRAARARREAEALIGRALRPPGEPPVLLLLDIDGFRATSAALGAAAGEALLAVTGARLEAGLAPGEQLLRLAGDGFLLLIPGGRDAAHAAARRAREAVSQPFILGGRSILMQASIGAAIPRTGEDDPARLLDEAEAALARAKAEGRNRIVFHEAGAEAALAERNHLELDLRQALGAGQMRLVYQPYIDLATGRISGAEALLRWRHPVRGEVAPASFIPLAEASGLILPLGLWALRAACHAAAGWPEPLTLAVNVSALMFHEPGFVAEVEAALAASGFPPHRLELEITETVLMRDNPETTDQLQALIARGIRIALDDFGTGYSALAYLTRLPHHRIKLDRSFVRDLRNPATAELIGAIIALARRNGVAVTAEGVERPEQIRAVTALGFTHAQGYATGAPSPDLPSCEAPLPVT